MENFLICEDYMSIDCIESIGDAIEIPELENLFKGLTTPLWN